MAAERAKNVALRTEIAGLRAAVSCSSQGDSQDSIALASQPEDAFRSWLSHAKDISLLRTNLEIVGYELRMHCRYGSFPPKVTNVAAGTCS